MASVSQQGLALIKRFEGLRLTSYLDSSNVWTIGWGHTGADVKPGMTITAAQADVLLARDLKRFEQGVQNNITRAVNQAQFDALVSFAYNIGMTGFSKSSVLRFLNAGDLTGAAEAFARWIRDADSIEEGLVRRRVAEIVRFLS